MNIGFSYKNYFTIRQSHCDSTRDTRFMAKCTLHFVLYSFIMELETDFLNVSVYGPCVCLKEYENVECHYF